MKRDLAGEVAVVTGAGRGFGLAIAERLGNAGARVCLIARTRHEIESAAADIERSGGTAFALATDVTERDAVEAAFAEVDNEIGTVSILVNNAGSLNAIGPFWEIDPDVWWREVEVHLRGTLLCAHEAIARMVRARRGRVINVVGLLGQSGEPYSTAYTCAKAAMYRLSECLSNELRDQGVSVFCMSPGPVLTEMTRRLVETEEGRRWLPDFAETPDDEWVPAEIGAELIYRLAQGDADSLSGRALHVSYDLDELISAADAIASEDRLALRITS
jgi:NAD(P)-dependent dehydrogenase (short-subunit alcohol dehydrogenase family)